MKIIDNIRETLKDDLTTTIGNKSKIDIAASCFSIYAYQVLKEQFESIDELRFIFTSPAFVMDRAKKEKREFYIPQLGREKSLYGTEFEVKLRNELTQKAIASGYARVHSVHAFKANYMEVFAKAERLAGLDKRGLWSDYGFSATLSSILM